MENGRLTAKEIADIESGKINTPELMKAYAEQRWLKGLNHEGLFRGVKIYQGMALPQL